MFYAGAVSGESQTGTIFGLSLSDGFLVPVLFILIPMFASTLVGLNMDDAVWDVTVFTNNRDRLLKAEVARKFFELVVDEVHGLDLCQTSTLRWCYCQSNGATRNSRPGMKHKEKIGSARPNARRLEAPVERSTGTSQRCGRVSGSQVAPDVLGLQRRIGLCDGAPPRSVQRVNQPRARTVISEYGKIQKSVSSSK